MPSNGTNAHPSTLLIPENVVWLPYASLVVLVLSLLGYDFYLFHRKNKLKYARMRETLMVESDHARKRINMISSVGLKYKNGLPDFGTVWNTSPSCSDVSTPSPSVKKSFPQSTDISPSDDGGLRHSDEEEGMRTASELSPHADGVPDDRRRIRAPRQVGSGGGGGERYRDDNFGSQISQGFVPDPSEDGNSATLNVTAIQKFRGRRSRERSGEGSSDGGGGGGVEGGGGGDGGGEIERQRKAAEDDELRFTDSRYQPERTSNNNNSNNSNTNCNNNNITTNNDNNSKVGSNNGCVIGDMSTQTSFTVADLHYKPGRTSPQTAGDGVYTHPGIANPRVIAISPQNHSVAAPRNASPHGHSSSSSPRSHHRSRHDSPASSSPRSRPAATAAEFAAQSMDDELNKPIIIDFSRSQSMREERCQDSPTNPATPRHLARRHEPRPAIDDYGPGDRSSKEPVAKDELVFPGSMRKAPSSQDVIKTLDSHSRHSHSHHSSSATAVTSTASSGKSRPTSSTSKRQHQHHHQQQPPPPSQQQHISSSSSRHSIHVDSYEDVTSSPRSKRSPRENRHRDNNNMSSSSNRKQTESHYRVPHQHLDARDSNSTIAPPSSTSPRESSRSSRSERIEPSSSQQQHQQLKQQHRESSSHRTSTKHSTPSTRQVKSARTSSSSPGTTSGDRRNRKSSDSSKHSSSESPKIPSHFYHQDEEGFFSSMSSMEHSSHSRMDSQQQLPRRGIHFFSQLGSGRRDSMAGGFGGRKISATSGGGGFGGDDGDGDYTSSSGYKGGGFDS